MRKIIIPAALAMIAALSIPAHAARYSCTLSQGSTQVKTCSIDTDGPACTHQYNANLVGGCRAVSGVLFCALANPTASIANVAQGRANPTIPEVGRTLSELPGFVAGAITLDQANAAIWLSYKESTSAPDLNLICK